jgi:TRAP-type C4-dicarboxylate transport system substrate-binding protein
MAREKQIFKKGMGFFFVVLMLFGVGVTIPTAQAAQPVTLKLSYPVPPSGLAGLTYEYFAKTVKEESQGQVVIQTYPSATLVADPEVLDAVRKGNVDIAHCMVSYISPTVKELTPLDVTGSYLASNYPKVQEKADPVAQKIYTKYNVHFLGSSNSGTLAFGAAKKVGKVIKTPADLKGLPIRSFGRWVAEAIKAWGAAPVTVPLGDVPVALERGTIAVTIAGWHIFDSTKVHEQAPYITFIDFPNPYQGMIMSEKAWGSLSNPQKEAVQRAVKKWQSYSDQMVNETLAKYKQTLKNAGATTYVLSAVENAAFSKVVDSVMEQAKPVAGPGGEELFKILAEMR